jgi:hypothetical protein
MGLLLKLAMFVGAVTLGVLTAYLAVHRPAPGDLIHPTVGNMQDLMFWMIALATIGAPAFHFAKGGFGAGAHWVLPLCLGAVLIYMELFNVTPFKEVACQMLLNRHHMDAPGHCYKGGV